ncbi:MAG: tetratricopeptide repeat protein, partial [Gammaproteobacteria bacterium]|nr:tetratricopeptide repeat protein [Gammaproteobacteria bacterium]
VTELVNTGLAEDMGCGHLRLHPALCPYLLGELAETEREQAASAWAGGMVALAKYLHKEVFKDAQLAFTLTLLELPNLLALLEYLHLTATAEAVVDLATSLETLLQNLGRPAALARVVVIREAAAAQLGAWSNARFQAEASSIDRMLQSGQLQQALDAAQDLLQGCLDAGEEAYDGADYDIAMAYFSLGRVLLTGGLSQAALQPLAEAQARFQVIADTGNRDAARMASVAITERGDCLCNLGRLDEAASAYQDAIQRKEKLDDRRGVAVSKGQLGTVRMLQQRYDDALEAYRSARDIFEQLGEPGSVAVIWHQTGMVHKEAGNFDAAEEAYRKALAIEVQQKDQPGEALSLGELGNLYDRRERLEEAVAFSRKAADIYVRIHDLAHEGVCRSNIADTLIKLQDFDEAREELQRALECKKPFGHAAEPWKTWMILHNLEQAVGNPAAAANARAEAIRAYLVYRRAGGENQNPGARFCALVAQAIQKGDTTEAEEILASYLTPDAESWAKAIIPALQAILRGSRDAALAEDSALDYDDAVELRLLLEGLG